MKKNDIVRIISIRIFFSEGYIGSWWREIFIIDSFLKTNPWIYKIKELNAEKVIGSFYENEMLRSILWMSYHPEPDIRIRDKVKVVLDLSSYSTKK